MRASLIPLLLSFLASSAFAADTHPFSVQDMVAMDRISEPRVSPDGKSVAFTLRVTDLDANRGRKDLWLASTAGGPARRLTSHEGEDSQPSWAPDGKSLFFVSTRSGSAQVFRLSLEGGEPQPVTNAPLDVDALRVAPGGQHLVFAMPVFPGKTPAETASALAEQGRRKASGRLYDKLLFRHWDTWSDGTRNHLFSYELASGKLVDLTPKMDADSPSKPMGGAEEYAISPDGRMVVFAARDVGREEAWSTNLDLFSAPIDGSAAPKKLTTNPATDTQPRFSPDGKSLAYLAMSRAGFEADRYKIVVRDWVAGSERSIVLHADASPNGDRSPSDLAWSLDGKELIVSADHVGNHALFAIDAASGAARVLVADGTVEDPQPMPDGKVLYGRNSLLGPSELYVAQRVARMAPIKITSLNDAKVASARFGKPEPFEFPGSHGATVHGWIVHPVDFDAAKKYPVAFLIHGGPQGSFGNDFHYRWNPQAYAGAGYAAVMVDFTGSTGYGQAFTDGIRDDWGGAPYDDLMKGLDYALGKYTYLDKDRMCALGASYGGWMINWIEGKTDRFKCLVSHDGNLDEPTAYYMTEELWFPEWEHHGTPFDNPEGYAKHNPISHVKNWKTPILVIHGEKDYRVVYTQGLSTFTAAQRKGIPSKLLVFPDENHWVLKPQNSILWHETVLGWLKDWIGKDAPAR
jgi:dipeptidyl aminopeptidase/acylaminoacyl peptidase